MSSATSESSRDRILGELLEAHRQIAYRPSASTEALRLAAGGSGDFGQALMAALCTLGGRHGPITEARRVIFGPPSVVRDAIRQGVRVTGWGSSFVKGERDEAFDALCGTLPLAELDRLGRITYDLWKAGKRVFPNAAAYTAVVANLLGLPMGTEVSLFIQGRMPTWIKIFDEARG